MLCLDFADNVAQFSLMASESLECLRCLVLGEPGEKDAYCTYGRGDASQNGEERADFSLETSDFLEYVITEE